MKTSNVNQVAAFGKLVGICNDLGARYNPSVASLTTTALAAMHEQAQQSLEAVNVARANYALAINHRQELFAGLYPWVARVVRALASSKTSPANLQDARALRRKLTSRSRNAATEPAVKEGSPAPTFRSSSALDFEGRVATFASLIKLLQGISSYAPNEADLKVTSLQALLNELRLASFMVATTANALANARIHRNKVLYGEEGMLETGAAVKEYIRSVFGVRSEPAREVSKIRLVS